MKRDRFTSFNMLFFASLAGFFGIGALFLIALERAGHLPPPPLTATECIDEKFKFIRDLRDPSPDLLAVGSSATWRNLDFSDHQDVHPGIRQPLNGAPCYLTVNQTAWLTRFYLESLPSVRTVVSVFAMRDFEGCDGSGQLFAPQLGRKMMFSTLPAFLVYFVNFRPLRLATDALHIEAMRSGRDARRPLVMDRYGSGPLTLTPPDPRGDVSVSQDCFAYLQDMERMLSRRGIRWVVVLMPPMPAWIDRYDPDGRRDRAWRERVARSLQTSAAILVDGGQSPFLKNEQFVDPAHFHWRWARPFTHWIFREMQSGGHRHLTRN